MEDSTIFVFGVLLFIVFMGVHGYTKGFIRIVLSIATMILALAAAYFLSPVITESVKETKIYAQINGAIYDFVEEQFSKSESVETSEKLTDDLHIADEDREKILSQLELPKEVKEVLDDSIKDIKLNEVGAKTFADTMAGTLTDAIFNAIAFIIIFALVNIVCTIIINILDIVSKLPVINTCNRTLGMVLALIEAIVILWLIGAIIMVISTSESGQAIVAAINDDPILSFIYDNNLLAELLIK